MSILSVSLLVVPRTLEGSQTLKRSVGVLMSGGLALGSAYLAISTVSVPAILLGNQRLWALKALNWGLVILTIATLLVSRGCGEGERQRADPSSQVGSGFSR